MIQQRLLTTMPMNRRLFVTSARQLSSSSSSSSLLSLSLWTKLDGSALFTTLQNNGRWFSTTSTSSTNRRRDMQRRRTGMGSGGTGGGGGRRRKAIATPKKILFQSLGCPRNFVDTEIMLGISVQSGLEVTQDIKEADYVVVNTCGFLESARSESKDAIEEMITSKKSTGKLLVTGCMVNLHRDQILSDYPQVDAVLGSGAIDKVIESIKSIEASAGKTSNGTTTTNTQHVVVESSAEKKQRRRSFLEQDDTPRFIATPKHYSYLKIAEGCKKQCSFCIIPKIKGKLQSKPINQLVNEFHGLLQYGTKEIIMIAQDLGDYGKDLKTKTKNNSFTTSMINHNDDGDGGRSTPNLAALLRELLQSTKDEYPDLWLRLLYLYPDEITTEILDVMESDDRICKYLDMPIQHSHDEILHRMRRKTTSQDILNTIRTLRTRFPTIHIRTSLMVGFPGETEEHFNHLLDFVRQTELDNVGVFTYSDEPLAYSSRLSNKVPEDVKEDRYHQLMQVQLEIVQRKNQRLMNSIQQVVIEGMDETNENIIGRYYGQCPDIDGQVIIADTNVKNKNHRPIYAGERYWVQFTDYDDYDLIGTIVDKP